MKIKELKDWLNNLPEDYSELDVMVSENKPYGEMGFHRYDKPVVRLIDANQSGLILIDVLDESEDTKENRPKSTPHSLDLTPNIFERGNRSRYHYIKSEEDYTSFLGSGMFWVHWPELSGNWEEDKKIIHNK